MGRGVKARRRLRQGERILTIPSGILWTVEHALDDALLGPALRSAWPPLSVEVILAVYLLFVRSRESGYEGRRSHVAALPASYSSLLFFTEDELQGCAGTSLYKQLLRYRIEDDYRNLVVRVLAQYPHLFPPDKFTIQDYKWAIGTVWSRAVDFQLSDGSLIRLLAPFADMFNHSPESQHCHMYDPLTGNLSVYAGKDYEAGDQVYISYGSLPNSRLLRRYGFITPGNPNDGYSLWLPPDVRGPFFEQQKILWALAGLNSACHASLTLVDPLPETLLRWLRISRLDGSDLATMALLQTTAVDTKISNSNELQVLDFLRDTFAKDLDGFRTQLEKVEEQLAKGVYPVGGNAWAAAHVSVAEQRVLRLARKRAEDLLAAAAVQSGCRNAQSYLPVQVPGQCAMCRKVFWRLSRCWRCPAVLCCGPTCPVAHIKSHDTIYRSYHSYGHGVHY